MPAFEMPLGTCLVRPYVNPPSKDAEELSPNPFPQVQAHLQREIRVLVKVSQHPY